MSENTKSIIFILGLFIGLPLGMLWLRDRVNEARSRRRNPPEKIAADRRAYEERLRQPNWEFYERHLQRPAPAALRQLYADHTLVTSQGLDYTEADRLNTFEALDQQNLIDSRDWIDSDIVAIATTDFGDPVYLRPGPTEPDIVYVTHHDGGDTEVFAESVAEFLEQLKQVNSAA